MTNEQIIFQHRLKLREDGIIGSTDQMIIIEHEDGTKESVFMPEEIHSFQGWKERGYVVKKGEHHRDGCAFPIWIPAKRSKKDACPDDDNDKADHMILKMTYFFTGDQVTKLDPK